MATSLNSRRETFPTNDSFCLASCRAPCPGCDRTGAARPCHKPHALPQRSRYRFTLLGLGRQQSAIRATAFWAVVMVTFPLEAPFPQLHYLPTRGEVAGACRSDLVLLLAEMRLGCCGSVNHKSSHFNGGIRPAPDRVGATLAPRPPQTSCRTRNSFRKSRLSGIIRTRAC